jgi:hypothetical protein
VADFLVVRIVDLVWWPGFLYDEMLGSESGKIVVV